MKQLLLAAALLAPLPAMAQMAPQVQPTIEQQLDAAVANVAAQLASVQTLISTLRNKVVSDQQQLDADKAQIADLTKQVAAAKKPAETKP